MTQGMGGRGCGVVPLGFRNYGEHREIGERVEQRLEELLEESARLRAALEALAGDGASPTRRPNAGRTTTSGIKTLGGNPPVRPSRGSAVTPAEPDAVDGNDAAQDAAVKRAVGQLRQELAAGLRNG
jgi:hypothetical protein